jgi:hypothetical protein
MSNLHEPVPCEVMNTEGKWISGYELLCFRKDGLLTIMNIRTRAVRELPPERWRDPFEEALLTAYAGEP